MDLRVILARQSGPFFHELGRMECEGTRRVRGRARTLHYYPGERGRERRRENKGWCRVKRRGDSYKARGRGGKSTLLGFSTSLHFATLRLHIPPLDILDEDVGDGHTWRNLIGSLVISRLILSSHAARNCVTSCHLQSISTPGCMQKTSDVRGYYNMKFPGNWKVLRDGFPVIFNWRWNSEVIIRVLHGVTLLTLHLVNVIVNTTVEQHDCIKCSRQTMIERYYGC